MRKTEYYISADVHLKIAVAADLHEHNPDRVLAILKEEQPDVVVIPGDLFENHEYGENLDRHDTSVLSRMICFCIHIVDKLAGRRFKADHDVKKEYSYTLLKEASQIAPVYMCLGNHEIFLTEDDKKILQRYQITLLEETYQEVKNPALSEGRLLIGGLTSLQTKETFDKEFLQKFSDEKDCYKILLCHHPEYYPQLKAYDFDLIISGHCHGGQISIFNHGLFGPGQGVFPNYHHGVYENRLVVSAGCANTASIPRWGNETEVVILHLESNG